MMKEKKKSPAWRIWLRRGVLALLLVTIGIQVYRYEQIDPQPLPAQMPEAAATAAPDARTLREIAYDKDIKALENLVQSGAADADTQQSAARRMERMIADHQAETAIEEALRQAGFDAELVLMQNNALTVMLLAHTISAEASAAILSICTAHADVSPENIRIMPSQE